MAAEQREIKDVESFFMRPDTIFWHWTIFFVSPCRCLGKAKRVIELSKYSKMSRQGHKNNVPVDNQWWVSDSKFPLAAAPVLQVEFPTRLPGLGIFMTSEPLEPNRIEWLWEQQKISHTYAEVETIRGVFFDVRLNPLLFIIPFERNRATAFAHSFQKIVGFGQATLLKRNSWHHSTYECWMVSYFPKSSFHVLFWLGFSLDDIEIVL